MSVETSSQIIVDKNSRRSMYNMILFDVQGSPQRTGESESNIAKYQFFEKKKIIIII